MCNINHTIKTIHDHIKEKNTYRYMVYKSNEHIGKYHIFKNFRVYWAYRWLEAEELDQVGVLGGTIFDRKIRYDKEYRFRYCPTNEIPFYKQYFITKWMTTKF